MANPPAVLEPVSSELQPLVDELGKLSAEDLRTVVRAVSGLASKGPPALHPTPPEILLAAAGIVALGGNAVDDERALYDG